MKKYIILFIAVCAAFLFWGSPKSVKAVPSLGILPTDSGPVNAQIIFNGSNFCIHNPGFPVIIMWDGTPIDTGTAPAFQVSYNVPGDAAEGQHTILATANCPGQPPTIPPSVDQITAYFTVISAPSGSTNGDTGTTDGTNGTTEDEDTSTTVSEEDEEADEDADKKKSEEDEDKEIPWYLNWIYLSLLGVGLLLIIGGIIWGVVAARRNRPKAGRPLDEKVQPKPISASPSAKAMADRPEDEKATVDKEVEKVPEKKEIRKAPKEDKKELPKSRIEYEE